nr:hypothetical protein [uncultured Cohaesibacter sp.]
MSLSLTYKVRIFQFYYKEKDAIIAPVAVETNPFAKDKKNNEGEKAMKTSLEGDFKRMDHHQALALITRHGPKRPRSLKQTLTLWLGRHNERRQMRRDLGTVGFTDAVLEDFGMSRQAAEKEASKYFWQA